MAPISPGDMSGPPRRPHRPTPTTKAHRFEPFSKRIAKIKIDPVHAVQRTKISEEHNDLSKSFFRSGLDEWAELNLTRTFTSFLNKASPLSESLPQLLHHADTIFDLLEEHIQKQEELALEPLLSLVAHLAHDLGQVYEKYFQRTVKLITQTSAAIEDPAAIESCFTCLAWMFKYMSKILVQDLRPVLGIMLPLMSAKKEYLRRFSAESLAFLIRKAAIMFAKKPEPLHTAVRYLFEQLEACEGEAETSLLENSLMTLFSESAGGVDAGLHSSAVDLMKCAFNIVRHQSDASDRVPLVLEGVVIHLIHRTNAAGFAPIMPLILSQAVEELREQQSHTYLALRLLLAVIATRKGSRITSWNEVIVAFQCLVQECNEKVTASRYRLAIVSGLAAILQYAPMDQLLPVLTEFLDQTLPVLTAVEFFTLCELVAAIGKQRFQDLLLPYLQQYILDHWRQGELGLCNLLVRMSQKGFLNRSQESQSHLTMPKEWEHEIMRRLTASYRDCAFEVSSSPFFQLTKAIHFPRDQPTKDALKALLSQSAREILSGPNTASDSSYRLSLGWALQSYFELHNPNGIEASMLWQYITEQSQEAFSMNPFLDVCKTVVALIDIDAVSESQLRRLFPILIANMLSEDVAVRKSTLKILKRIGQLTSTTWLCSTVELMSEIMGIAYNPSSARQIEMLIRRLAPAQLGSGQQPPLRNLVPVFTMGMLRHYHDHTRRVLCEAVSEMVTSGNAEDVIVDIVTQWLQAPVIGEERPKLTSKDDQSNKLSPYECSNLNMVERLVAEVYEQHLRPTDQLRADFELAHQLHPSRSPVDSRALALQVFLEMPELAERKSRLLIPVFLSIPYGRENIHSIQSDESISSHTISPDLDKQVWSLRERKIFLELIGKFGNPKVLYRSGEVYNILLELLTNGNTEVRKLALNAIFNWKDASIKHYQDVLLRVAEEKTATTELALLLSNNEESGSIKPQDRSSVLHVLLRLVFGQLIGRSGNHGSQESKRRSILRLLFKMDDDEVKQFLKITQGRLAEACFTNADGVFQNFVLTQDLISTDQQYGFLRMVLSMIEILQNQFGPFVEDVIMPVLYCTARGSHQISLVLDDTGLSSGPALAHNIRRTGIQCLSLLYEQGPNINWLPYTDVVFSELVIPRLDTFAVETAQGISALLRMFSTWAKFGQLLPFLFDHDKHLLPTLWNILVVPSARNEVKLYVLTDILEPLLEHGKAQNSQASYIAKGLTRQIDIILTSLAYILGNEPSKDILLASTRLLPQLAQYADTSTATSNILDLLITLLCEPNQRIPPHIKGSLLQAAKSLLHIENVDISSAAANKLYEVVAAFYSYFKDHPNRAVLSEILLALNGKDDIVRQAIMLCRDLNAQSTKQLGEIDYDKRLAAFNTVNALEVSDGSRRQWLPILHNLLYSAKTADDFAIRSNAVNCLKRYVTAACQTSNLEMQYLVRNCLLPAFKKGTCDNSELVRADFVALFGLVVRFLQNAPELEDLKVLLVGDDEEASFYMNILHIQQHRRIRAIRRLTTEVENGKINPTNVADFFLPLLEKFINDDSPDESAQGVKGQTIVSTSTLLQWVDWKSFRRIYRQYKQYLMTGARSEKETIKLLNNATDALTNALKGQDDKVNEKTKPHLATTIPSIEIVREELKTNFIPKLSEFIHHRDEAEISLRTPAAQMTVKMIQLLSPEEVPSLVAPILLDISQILRSRTQESRDVARNTLANIVELMGPSSIHFVLKELRTTLTRGYQLHVLSYTMHTILLVSSRHQVVGEIDYCLDELAAVIMDDIFGIVGQEKENQDYISSMKEVKSSKSFDSMEHLARVASVKALSKLVAPFKTLLMGHLTTKQTRHVDELMRRLGVGIAHNEAASSRELLVFAYELIQAFYKQKATPAAPVLTNAERNRARYIVQLDSAIKARNSTSSALLFKIARFALDIVRSTLLKNPALLTPENVHGFLPVVGDALVEAQEDVKISALRLLSAIIKLPIAELDSNASLYIIEAVKIVKGSVNTNEEASQAALKLVAAVLRERRNVKVRDSDISYLLSRTMPDLEEPDKQGVTFNFVKSVMARRYELPEIYDLMDKIGVMMVTSQSRNSRDAARGVYVHFLLEYPQSKNRWTKQLKFLIKNLEYQYPEGRQSIMEAIHVLVQKSDNDQSQELISTTFVPVILRLANDENIQCREIAGTLLSRLYSKANSSQLKTLLELLRAWIEQTENEALTRLSFQAWTIFFDLAPEGAEVEVAPVRSAILRTLEGVKGDDNDWEQGFQALELFQKLVSTYPTTELSSRQSTLWKIICSYVNAPQRWIQSSAAGLITHVLQDCINSGSIQIPLTTAYGLKFGPEAVLNILKNSIKVLKRNESSQELADKTINNLVFLGKYVDNNKMTMKVKAELSEPAEDKDFEISDGVASDFGRSSDSEDEEAPLKSITALQYLLDQCIHILRREPSKLVSSAFLPRLSALKLLAILLPHLSTTSLPASTMTALLIPLTYITDPNVQPPRSTDPLFPQTYLEYTSSAHSLLEAVQSKLGDSEYVRLMTEVSKIVRQRREGRRQKRAIERVAEPERAAQYKRRKEDRKKDRKKEVKDMYRKKRRGDLGF